MHHLQCVGGQRLARQVHEIDAEVALAPGINSRVDVALVEPVPAQCQYGGYIAIGWLQQGSAEATPRLAWRAEVRVALCARRGRAD